MPQARPLRVVQQFLDATALAVPADLDVHLILDPYQIHETQLIRNWLAKRPRFPRSVPPPVVDPVGLVILLFREIGAPTVDDRARIIASKKGPAFSE